MTSRSPNVLLGVESAGAPACGSMPAERVLLKLRPVMSSKLELGCLIIAVEAPLLSDVTIAYQALALLQRPDVTPWVFLTEPSETVATALFAATLALDTAEAGTFALTLTIESVPGPRDGPPNCQAFAFIAHRTPPPNCSVLVAPLPEDAVVRRDQEILSAAALWQVMGQGLADASRPTTLLLGRIPGRDRADRYSLLADT